MNGNNVLVHVHSPKLLDWTAPSGAMYLLHVPAVEGDLAQVEVFVDGRYAPDSFADFETTIEAVAYMLEEEELRA